MSQINKSTLKVITGKVGEGGITSGIEMRRVQQLLALNLMLRKEDVSGTWSNATKEAILDYKTFFNVPDKERTPYFMPTDPYNLIFNLCKGAGVLLSVPSTKVGADAFNEFFAITSDRDVPYGWSRAGKADRVAYGLEGFPEYIIFTNVGGQFDLDDCPISMNCISFTNLAISIWRTGKAHAAPYIGSQMAGGFLPVAMRYGLDFIRNPSVPGTTPSVLNSWDFNLKSPPKSVKLPAPLSIDNYDTYFYGAKEVLSVVKPDQLYYLEWCRLNDMVAKNGKVTPSGFGHHDTVLFNGNVYEINIPKRPKNIRMTSLEKRFKESPEAVRVMGPV